jgi:hypothetical protein
VKITQSANPGFSRNSNFPALRPLWLAANSIIGIDYDPVQDVTVLFTKTLGTFPVDGTPASILGPV